MKFMYVFVFISVMTLLVGCSSSSEIGSEQTIGKSGSTPDWINRGTFEGKDSWEITGVISKAYDKSFGMKQSYADGVQNLMNTMVNKVKSQSSQALQGANMDDSDVGRFSQFAVGWISDTYRVAGVANPENYWEKVEVKTLDGVKYYYNCYSLITISKLEYNKALAGAYDNMKKKAQEENNKKAEETAQKLIDSLNNNQ